MNTTAATQPRSAHPHPIPGGSPLLRAATRTPAADRRAAWHGLAIAAVLMLAVVLSGCTTLHEQQTAGESAYSGEFDPRWMTVVIVDDGTVPHFCQHQVARDGCAKVWQDQGAAAPHPTDTTRVPRGIRCTIIISRRFLPETRHDYRRLLAHEVRHCRGWTHVGQ